MYVCVYVCAGKADFIQWHVVLSVQLPSFGFGEGGLYQHGLLQATFVHTDTAHHGVSGWARQLVSQDSGQAVCCSPLYQLVVSL